MKPLVIAACAAALILPAACSRLEDVGKAPSFDPVEGTNAYYAMTAPDTLPMMNEQRRPVDQASLWAAGRKSLLGDHRASRRGDILTVAIEIDDKAEISNSTQRSRSGSESMGIPQLFGLPQRLNEKLPLGATMDPAVSTDSTSSSAGDGSVSR